MSVRATVVQQLTVQETLSTGVPASSNPVITHSGFNKTKQLNATSTPPATKVVSISGSLTAGAATLDLTNLTGTNGATVTFAGLRVQAMYFENLSSSNTMTIQGGANPYEVFGHASGYVTLGPGASILIYTADYAPADVVNSTTDEIALSGTGTDSYYCELLAG